MLDAIINEFAQTISASPVDAARLLATMIKRGEIAPTHGTPETAIADLEHFAAINHPLYQRKLKYATAASSAR